MKKTMSLILALTLCFALAAPALAAESLTSEIAAAYLDIVEELAREYGAPPVKGDRAGQDVFYGMCGGYVVDLGDGGAPELIVACSKKGTYIDSSFFRVYTYNGANAVLVSEETVLASANGRSWFTYTLCRNGDSAWLDQEWESLPSYDYVSGETCPGTTELTHLHMDNGKLTQFTPAAEAASPVRLGTYDYITFNNYDELLAELKNPSASGPTAPAGISITVNGKAVDWTDAEPFIDENDRTMVPLRAVADAMGLQVSWDAAAREAAFTDGARTIYFPIDSSDARADDGGAVEMDTAAVIANNRTYAPIRYLAEFFGYQVGWDAGSRTVVITR